MFLTREESVTLAMLTTIGSVALASGHARELVERFERKFGVVIDDERVVSLVNKVGDLLSGTENVVTIK